VLSPRIKVLDVVFDGLQLAGFQVSITGRFWVSTEVLGAAAFFASYLPARRAATVDPMVALRRE
jgi:ABC-type lipoprotein release transport system permease subunit